MKEYPFIRFDVWFYIDMWPDTGYREMQNWEEISENPLSEGVFLFSESLFETQGFSLLVAATGIEPVTLRV